MSLTERVEPFRALLYNREHVRNLRDVVAPPYDLIGTERQNELYERSPHNVVRLELGREPDRYGASATTLERWRREGIMELASRPAFYLYTQLFEHAGWRRRRDGIVTRMRLEEFSSGRILPHEKTFPAAKQDRLQLLTALRANISSIFGLYSGHHNQLAPLLAEASQRRPLFDLVDDLEITNQLRAIDSPEEIRIVQEALADGRILIADGHHRYETALNYRRVRREAEGDPRDLQPYDYTMMTLVAMEDPGLVILPTHRVVKSLPVESIPAFESRAQEIFDVTPMASRDRLVEEITRGGIGTIGVVLRPGATFVVRLRDHTALKSALPATPPFVQELDVSILHALILDRFFGLKPEDVKKGGKLDYTIDTEAALDAVFSGNADGAFLMKPPTIRDVERVSNSGATMPEKSTYFFPKLITGLFMNSLDD